MFRGAGPKGYRSPGRRAMRRNLQGKVWWPSIYVDKEKKPHHLMYIENPVKFVWTRWPISTPERRQNELVMKMVEQHEQFRSEGYLGG